MSVELWGSRNSNSGVRIGEASGYIYIYIKIHAPFDSVNILIGIYPMDILQNNANNIVKIKTNWNQLLPGGLIKK